MVYILLICAHQAVLLLLLFLQDKQAESLRERLVVRLQLGGPREWRLVSWCIAQLGYSEKGLKRVMEMTACYRHTLGEQQVGCYCCNCTYLVMSSVTPLHSRIALNSLQRGHISGVICDPLFP
jgi:hypothetical protein